MSLVMQLPIVRIIAGVGVSLVLVYAALLAAAVLLQEAIIFPTALARFNAHPTPPPGVERVWLPIDDGDPSRQVEAWFVAGDGRSAESPGPAVMFFHGNADLIDRAVDIADLYTRLGVSVLLPEYRGYGRSAGRPSQRRITDDMVRFRDWLDARPEVDPRRIIYHGQSLGAGVAAALGDQRPPAAFILQSPFKSIASMMRRYGVPAFLARHPFRVDRTLTRLNLPTLIIHGARDEVIPVSHGRSLHKMLPGSRYVEPDAGHNDLAIFSHECVSAVEGFLRANDLLP